MADTVIAVIDDDALMLDLMDILLTQAGYQTILCADAADAYDLIRRSLPALVIQDLQMGRDLQAGWTILSLVRMDPATTQVPVLLCSANGVFLRARQETLRAQGCDTIVKPFDPNKLLGKVAAMIGPPRAA